MWKVLVMLVVISGASLVISEDAGCQMDDSRIFCSHSTIEDFNEIKKEFAQKNISSVTIWTSNLTELVPRMFDSGYSGWSQYIWSINFDQTLIEKVDPLSFYYYNETNKRDEPLPNLTSLFLQGSRLKIIDSKMFVIPALYELILTRNKIEHIENYAFKNLTNLKVLDLSNNSLQVLQETVFDNLHNVSLLHLDNNKNLTLINQGVLQDLRGLEYLMLANTNLTLDFGYFSTLQKMQGLDISSTKINVTYLTPLINLTNLIMLNNSQELGDFNNIPEYLPKLRVLAIDNHGYNFKCRDLINTWSILRKNKIEVWVYEPIYRQRNIDGIYCN